MQSGYDADEEFFFLLNSSLVILITGLPDFYAFLHWKTAEIQSDVLGRNIRFRGITELGAEGVLRY